LNGRQVIAIDTRIEELKEVANNGLKVVMDAAELGLQPSSFEVVSSFFSLMYMVQGCHPKVFRGIHRVLKDGGIFLTWDVKIPSRPAGKALFVVPLRIVLPDTVVDTSYGVRWHRRCQDLAYFKALARKTDFHAVREAGSRKGCPYGDRTVPIDVGEGFTPSR